MSAFRKEYPAIYIGNLHRQLSESQLQATFESLASFQLLKNRDGSSKGWGFLCFSNNTSAEAGRAFLRSARYMIRGLTIEVGTVRAWSTIDQHLSRRMDNTIRAANPAAAPADIKAKIAALSHSVFVGNLPGRVTTAELRNLFAPAGDIISAFVATNSQRECLGYGFIDFDEEASCYRALERFDGYVWGGKMIRVDIGADVNREVVFPVAPPAAPVPARQPTSQAPWAAVLPIVPAPVRAAVRVPVVPVVPAVPVVRAEPKLPAKSSDEALSDTIRLIAPELLQAALAVNAAEGLQFGLGVEEASERLVRSKLLRVAVKGLVGKLGK